jgi:hypothetical protein
MEPTQTGQGTWGAGDCQIQCSGQWKLKTGGWDKAYAWDGRYLHRLAGPRAALPCTRHNVQTPVQTNTRNQPHKL